VLDAAASGAVTSAPSDDGAASATAEDEWTGAVSELGSLRGQKTRAAPARPSNSSTSKRWRKVREGMGMQRLTPIKKNEPARFKQWTDPGLQHDGSRTRLAKAFSETGSGLP
jgi:hypothetical protein